MMSTKEMIIALKALAAQQNQYDDAELAKRQYRYQEQRTQIQTYSDKYQVMKNSGKGFDSRHFQKETDTAYYTLLDNLGAILPMSETDGKVGKSFYLSTCPECSEFIRITVSRTNGVSAEPHVETKTVAEAQEYASLTQKINDIARLRKNLSMVEKLARSLAATLSALETE